MDRDETEPYNETIFGRRRPDSIAVEWTSKVLYVLEFKRTSDQRRNDRERGEARARAQHDVLVKSLEKVAGEAVGENSGWRIKLIIFVGGTCGVDQCTRKRLTTILRYLGLSSQKETQSGKDSCTSCLMHKTRSCAHTLQWKKLFKGWTSLNEIWRGTVGRRIGRKTTRGKHTQVS